MNQTFELPEFFYKLTEDHPVKVYYEENIHLKTILFELASTAPTDDPQKFYNLFNQLCEVEKRYVRKENQLFPFLEKRGWTGPSHGMWAFHDSNRALLKAIRTKVETRNFSGLDILLDQLHSDMQRMIYVEEHRLFPISMDLLKDEDWQAMKAGESEIGYMHKQAAPMPESPPAAISAEEITGLFKIDEGRMNLEQINLLLRFVPFDLTYVDENDKVVFYNRGEDRVFPRSAGIIGREVKFCHPPKSVHTVLKILEEFKNGNQSQAEFWIKFKARTIHIRYFAIRDSQKNYKGVIEVSQDITEIQKLEGERRLLNWS